MKNKGVVFIVQGAMIAALYVVLTMLANALGLSSYSIQIRFSEALCILPFFTPAAIPGLWIGCLIANMVIVPFVLRYGYGFKTIYKGIDWSIPFNVVTVGIGEIISVCILGSLLLKVLSKYRNVLFAQSLNQ